MGDHRLSFKAEIEFNGVKDKCDFWIHWSPDWDFGGIDKTIAKFVMRVHDEGMDNHNQMLQEAQEEQHKEQIESAEKTELKRLKKKYDKK